ncbi:MAG: fibronectin type III domain-containing protein [Cyclobacteriaceae bacterium]
MAHNNTYIRYRTKVGKYCLCFTLSFMATSCSFDDVEPSGIGNSKITIVTSAASDITRYTAKLNGTLGDTYGRTVEDYGHCWGTSAEPDLSNPHTSLKQQSEGKDFSSDLEGLLIDTWYYARTYFVIDNQTVYGNHIVFKTEPPSLPTVLTTNIDPIGSTGATAGGTIDNNGGVPIIEYGICWNTTGSPDKNDFKESDNSDTLGSFSFELTNLDAGTPYYVRAFATNREGTEYGYEVDFMTD